MKILLYCDLTDNNDCEWLDRLNKFVLKILEIDMITQ